MYSSRAAVRFSTGKQRPDGLYKMALAQDESAAGRSCQTHLRRGRIHNEKPRAHSSWASQATLRSLGWAPDVQRMRCLWESTQDGRGAPQRRVRNGSIPPGEGIQRRAKPLSNICRPSCTRGLRGWPWRGKNLDQ